MTTSKTIAGLIGPTLVAIAAGMLLNIGSFPELAEQVSRDPALIFVSGILLFVAGLAIVRVHDRWTDSRHRPTSPQRGFLLWRLSDAGRRIFGAVPQAAGIRNPAQEPTSAASPTTWSGVRIGPMRGA